MIFWILTLSVGLLLLVLRQRKWKNSNNEPPYLPKSWPFFGHLSTYLQLRDGDSALRLLIRVCNDCTSVGGVARTVFGPWKIYFVTDPEDGNTLLNSCLEKDSIYNFWHDWLGNGMISAPLSIWKPQRKLLTPAYGYIMLNKHCNTFNRRARNLTEFLSYKVGTGPFDFHRPLTLEFLRLFIETSLGVTGNDKMELSEFLEYVQKMHQCGIIRFINILYHNEAIYKWSLAKKKQDVIVKVLKNFSEKLIEKRRNIIKQKQVITNHPDESKGEEPKIFLDTLIEAVDNGDITNQQLIDEVNTFIFAGHDTSATTLTYALILLGSRPQVQDRLYKELQSCFTESKKDVKLNDLPKLPYLNAVLKEALRLYSFVFMLPRTVDKDLKLKNCTLAAGTRCGVLAWGIHRHPTWGPDAEEFRPERWLDESSISKSPGAFAGFSIGKRSCLGKKFAQTSTMIALAHIVNSYRISSEYDKFKLTYEGVLKPKTGYYISVEKRI